MQVPRDHDNIGVSIRIWKDIVICFDEAGKSKAVTQRTPGTAKGAKKIVRGIPTFAPLDSYFSCLLL